MESYLERNIHQEKAQPSLDRFAKTRQDVGRFREKRRRTRRRRLRTDKQLAKIIPLLLELITELRTRQQRRRQLRRPTSSEAILQKALEKLGLADDGMLVRLNGAYVGPSIRRGKLLDILSGGNARYLCCYSEMIEDRYTPRVVTYHNLRGKPLFWDKRPDPATRSPASVIESAKTRTQLFIRSHPDPMELTLALIVTPENRVTLKTISLVTDCFERYLDTRDHVVTLGIVRLSAIEFAILSTMGQPSGLDCWSVSNLAEMNALERSPHSMTGYPIDKQRRSVLIASSNADIEAIKRHVQASVKPVQSYLIITHPAFIT